MPSDFLVNLRIVPNVQKGAFAGIEQEANAALASITARFRAGQAGLAGGITGTQAAQELTQLQVGAYRQVRTARAAGEIDPGNQAQYHKLFNRLFNAEKNKVFAELTTAIRTRHPELEDRLLTAKQAQRQSRYRETTLETGPQRQAGSIEALLRQIQVELAQAHAGDAEFVKITAQLSAARRLLATKILEEEAATDSHIKVIAALRTAQAALEVRVRGQLGPDYVAAKAGQAVQLQRLANDTKEAAQATAGYAADRRRSGELSAKDRQLSQEGARRVTDTPAARVAAATRRISLQGFELQDPQLVALQTEFAQNRRLVLTLAKRSLLLSTEGQAALARQVALDEEITALRQQARDQFKNSEKALGFREKRNVQTRAEIESPDYARLRQLEGEQAVLARRRRNATQAQLLVTEEGRTILAEEARINAEIAAIRRKEAKVVNERVAAEARIQTRRDQGGGGGPGFFERLQGGLQGPGFAQALGRRFITTGQFALSAVTFRSAIQGIKAVITEAEDLQRSFSLIEAQFKSIGQAGDFATFRTQILGIARDTGVSAAEVAKVGFQIKGVFGADTQKAIKETRAAIRAALVTGLPQKEIVDSLTAASLAYGTSIDSITDKAVGVEERFGVLSQESLKFFGDIADTAASTGLGLDELGAVVGVLQRDLGIAGSQLSEQFSRVLGTLTDNSSKIVEIYTRYPQLAARLPQLQESIGKGSGAVLFELASGYDSLSEATQKAIAYQLGGSRQFRVVNSVLQGLNKEIQKGTVHIDDSGKALEREKNLQETVAIQMDRLRESFRQFGDAIFEAGIGDALVQLLHGLGGVAEVVGGILRIFGTLNAATHGWLSGVLLLGAAFLAIQTTMKTVLAIQLAMRAAQTRLYGAAGADAAAGAVRGPGMLAFASRGRFGMGGGLAPGEFGPPAPTPGFGAAARSTFGAVGPTVALIGAGMFFSYISSRRQAEQEMYAKVQGQLEAGDEKDIAAIKQLAEQRSSYGERFKASFGMKGFVRGLETIGNMATGNILFHPENIELETPQNIARKSLEQQQREYSGQILAQTLQAMSRIKVSTGVLGPAPKGAGSLTSGLLGGLYDQGFDPQVDAAIKQVYGDKKTLQDLVSGLQAGDKATFDKMAELLRILNRNPDFRDSKNHDQFLALLKQIQDAADADKTVAGIKVTVEGATRLYQMGRLTSTEFKKILEDNLKALQGTVATLKAEGKEVPPDIQTALDNTQKAVDDVIKTARDNVLKLAESLLGINKSKTQDPQTQAGIDQQIAKLRLDAAKAAYNEAVSKAGGKTDTPEVQAAATALNDAKAYINQAAQAKQRTDDEIADAQTALDRAKEGGSKNELRNARRAKEDADRQLERAKNEGLGPLAELRAQTSQIEADRSIADAIFNIGQSRLKLLQAIASAAGDDVKAAELSVREVRAELTKQLKDDPTDEGAVNGLKAQLVTERDRAAATRVSHTKELLDFQVEMGEITVGQEIAALEALLGSPDVQSNEARVREIRLAIKSLKDQTSNDLQFNIGDLHLPTLYEVRRLGATRDAGAGYQDNRQVAITITVNNQGDLDGALEAFSQAVNAPSRYGTSPRAFAYRN